jgi:hypothetical protein
VALLCNVNRLALTFLLASRLPRRMAGHQAPAPVAEL